MQTAVHKQFLILGGLIVLSLLVLAAGAQVVRGIVTIGAGGPSGGSASSSTLQFADLTAARVAQQHGVVAMVGTSQTASQGGNVSGSVPVPAPGKITVPTSSTSSSGTSSTAWIISGAVIAALVVFTVAWALLRRRRRSLAASPGSAAFCTLHPDDALCGAV